MIIATIQSLQTYCAVIYHSQACTQSLEELTKLGVEDEEVDVEEEEEEEAHELSTISEEQGEL